MEKKQPFKTGIMIFWSVYAVVLSIHILAKPSQNPWWDILEAFGSALAAAGGYLLFAKKDSDK